MEEQHERHPMIGEAMQRSWDKARLTSARAISEVISDMDSKVIGMPIREGADEPLKDTSKGKYGTLLSETQRHVGDRRAPRDTR